MTPLVPVQLVVQGRPRTVYLKLESANPGGSLKDRTAASLVADLEERGVLTRGSVLVESTSGNLGVSLATIARARGYGFVAVVDPKTTGENLARLRRLGAGVELVDRPDGCGGYLLSRLERVHELCAASERFVWPNQYENPANPRAHELGTGPEILAQMGGQVDALLAPVSTGGTLAGLGRCFRAESPATRIVAVDARGSVALGGTAAARLLTGIGASRRSSFLSAELFDDLVRVRDSEAFAFCHALAASAGLKLGGSSGAVVAAAGHLLAGRAELDRAVCVCADRGANYERSIYDPRWLGRHGIRLTRADLGPVEEILPGAAVLAAV